MHGRNMWPICWEFTTFLFGGCSWLNVWHRAVLGSIDYFKPVKDVWSLTVVKIACVQSVNLKTYVSLSIQSDCLCERAMAGRPTQDALDAADGEHESKMYPSPAVVFCSNAWQEHAAATCAICVFLSRVLLQESNLASNLSAASIRSVQVALTPKGTFYRPLSTSSNSPDVGHWGSRECTLDMMSRCNRALPAQSVHHVHQYYCWLTPQHQKDGSALLRELEAFISACHEGLLQKFALPGILDWMKFMRSVSLILLVLGVPPDEPTSFPMSRRFASMFAFSIFLTISIQDEAGHF